MSRHKNLTCHLSGLKFSKNKVRIINDENAGIKESRWECKIV